MFADRPITFRQEIEDGVPITYAVYSWPERTMISRLMLLGASDTGLLRENESGEIIIAVANGTATYKRSKEQPNGDYIVCELCWSSWRPR